MLPTCHNVSIGIASNIMKIIPSIPELICGRKMWILYIKNKYSIPSAWFLLSLAVSDKHCSKSLCPSIAVLNIDRFVWVDLASIISELIIQSYEYYIKSSPLTYWVI